SRPLDAETDLFPLVDWSKVDLVALAKRLPKDARPADSQLVRLRAGEHGIVTESATPMAGVAAFDAAYAARAIGDLVPNAFAAWALVDGLLAKLKALGWDDML